MCGKMGTYESVTPLPVRGRVVYIDSCIHHIVAALNAGGIETTSSCCGHGKQDGSILLADGRELVVRKWVPPLSVARQTVRDLEQQVTEAKALADLAKRRNPMSKPKAKEQP